MDRTRTFLCWVYYALAAIALCATQKQNIAFMAERNADFFHGFAQFWPALLVNHATISISVDLFVFALAAMLWMLYEARRLQLRFVWLYLVFGIVIAISVTFPLFLAARERRLFALQAPHTQGTPSVLDWIPFALLGVGSLAFVFYAAML
jgi:hypothetical protein